MDKTDHEHKKYVSQCEEGCGCDLLFINCHGCDLFEPVEGWVGCNVDWVFWTLGDEPMDEQYIKDKAQDIRNHYDAIR